MFIGIIKADEAVETRVLLGLKKNRSQRLKIVDHLGLKPGSSRLLLLCSILFCSFVFVPMASRAELGDFKGYEIRVIRPRFMSKRNRFELGAQSALIMNQSFIYTLMVSGMLDYHFSEMFAFEVNGQYGFKIDKEDKRLLESEFDISTQILQTQYVFSGGLLWTPIYGKTQLSSGQVVYFDDFIILQAGMTGIYYDYKQCEKSKNSSNQNQDSSPTPKVVSYPSLNIGLGQKYFLTQDFSLRWDVKDNIFSYNTSDGACAPDDGVSDIQNNITLSFGASTFF